MSIMKLVSATVLALTLSASVNATVISPVSGIIVQGNNNDFNPITNNVANVIDDVINFDQFLSFRNPNTLTPIVLFDLGNSFALTGVSFWNNGGFIGNDGEGLAQFTLNLIDEGLSSITSQVFNPNDGLAQQDFSLIASGVRFVEMTINAGNSNTRTIFHEIQFTSTAVPTPGTAVPTPGTLALIAAGLFGFFASKRRRHAGNIQAV